MGLFLAAGVRLVLPVLLLLVVALCAFTFFVFLSGTRRCDDAVKLHARTISHSWGVQSVRQYWYPQANASFSQRATA